MKLRPTYLVLIFLILSAAIPACAQQNTFGIDVGQVSDKFGALSSVTGLDFNINGQVTVLHSKAKEGTPSIVVGGEVRLPTDTNAHAKEFAVYGGPQFQIHNFSFGFSGQVRKIILPTAFVDNQFLPRATMELLEIPVNLRYSFGSSHRAYIEAKGAPEFTPRFHLPPGSILPKPSFDHGYFVRGTVGYNFGRYYARASYESRYFRFTQTVGNPGGLYNWRSNTISGGIGVTF
jgi:hypothetical protein